jgi:hypothetical protein
MNPLPVRHVGNYAKRERCAADKDFVGIDAIDILARNHGPLDLVIVAAAADKRHAVHAGKRVRNFRAVEEDGSRSILFALFSLLAFGIMRALGLSLPWILHVGIVAILDLARLGPLATLDLRLPCPGVALHASGFALCVSISHG